MAKSTQMRPIFGVFRVNILVFRPCLILNNRLLIDENRPHVDFSIYRFRYCSTIVLKECKNVREFSLRVHGF